MTDSGLLSRKVAHYVVLDRIGKGGMGEVYLARDSKLGRKVALKVLPSEFASDPDRLARFRREARVLAGLSHPNIVTIYSVEDFEGNPVLAMELIEGETLAEKIPDSGMDFEQLLKVLLPILNALDAVHRRGIVHRDLKPANVLVSTDGTVKLLDFGLAEGWTVPAQTDTDETLVEISSGTAGTPQYAAPEQLKGLPTGPAADIFSLGALAYQVATGVRPFRGDSIAEVVSAVLTEEPPPVSRLRPDYPPAFSSLLEICLRKDPGSRFRSVSEIAEQLGNLSRSKPADLPEYPPAQLYRSVAVLPFQDLSMERDEEYFCLGVADEVIGSLSSIEGVRVASRTSSFAYKSSNLDIREIGRQLGVDTVLEGSVRKAGRRLRISTELIDVANGYQLWSRRFDSELEDVFAVQDEIADCAYHCLRGVLAEAPDASRNRADEEGQEGDLEIRYKAYDLYLRGRHLLRKPTLRTFDDAYDLFKSSAEIDPSFAKAYAGMAEALVWKGQWFGLESALMEEAEEASKRAISLAPESGDAHVARGLVLSLNGDVTGAEESLKRAVSLDKGLFEAHYMLARVRLAGGDSKGAIEAFEEAAAVDPFDFQAPLLVASLYRELGDTGQEVAAVTRGLALAEKHLELQPDNERALYLGAGALVVLGRLDRAAEWADRALKLDPEDPAILYNVACVYSQMGDLDKALEILESLIRAGFGYTEWIERDPDLEPLKEHPRYEDFVSLLRTRAR